MEECLRGLQEEKLDAVHAEAEGQKVPGLVILMPSIGVYS